MSADHGSASPAATGVRKRGKRGKYSRWKNEEERLFRLRTQYPTMTWKEFHRRFYSHYTPSPGVISSKYNHLLKAGFTLPETVFPPRDYTPTPSGNSIYSDDDAATHISFEAGSPSGPRLDYFERHSASESRLRDQNHATLPIRNHSRLRPEDSDSDFSDTGHRNGDKSSSNRQARKPRGGGGFASVNGGSGPSSSAERLQAEKKLRDVEETAKEIRAAWEEVREAIRDVMFVEQWDRGGMGPKTTSLETSIDRLIEQSAISKPASSTHS
ncbi:hypothetical protein MGYG_05415 [Nannizzia gypsea CBS 118893]|uniref:Uncharacterized protein n=1 Tax=Arthroderma gypseum (strain ATCC MYA-4604 / CBS 118893) TaxID=535722 RepID=E4UVU3_ARTGP|nr:hypothetical protein MGYG_05415 [Nannizzia gypsea CBS 118893]EFR02420.1 hypothetical protein MGYG_05415 [Nannizzia gypsea CBS 118893]